MITIYLSKMAIFIRVYSFFSRIACRFKAAVRRMGIVKPRKAPLPVISIGNLTLGGSEKTPLAMELLGFLQSRGFRPALVTRGYKGKWEHKGGVLSDGKTLYGGWEEAGDEPYMAARRYPGAGVFIGKRRYRSCLKAKESGFDVAVLDDGFQHIGLGRGLDIVLHDLGTRQAFREGLSSLKRADILLLKRGVTGRACAAEVDPRAKPGAPSAGDERASRNIRARFPALSIFEYAAVSQGLRALDASEFAAAESLKGKTVLAFCGIARPERFFSLLEASGIRLGKRMIFPDHYAYPPSALANIARICGSIKPGALVTTEKDAIKIAGRTGAWAPVPTYMLNIGLDLPPAFFEKILEYLGHA
jgi:tetraacyldisaccharide 4'-kinase